MDIEHVSKENTRFVLWVDMGNGYVNPLIDNGARWARFSSLEETMDFCEQVKLAGYPYFVEIELIFPQRDTKYSSIIINNTNGEIQD